ncbi:hypothetical protein VPH35_135643 [Triticum aestivum]
MTAMDPECAVYRDLAADVLANILTRLPPNTRRRLRLVCRHWRDVVGTRTATNLQNRAKTLVVAGGSAYVFGHLSTSTKPLWADYRTSCRYEGVSVVGTCNALVCICDDRDIGDTIVVANPVTGEALSVPPLPPTRAIYGSTCYIRTWRDAYSFAYLPTSGRYKVVHVPCAIGKFVSDAVHKVMSFDAEHERVTPIPSLPPLLSFSEDKGSWHLAEVRGRLAVIFNYISLAKDMTEVWVMEGKPTARQIRWSRWYVVRISMPHHWLREPRAKPRRLTWPLFVHGEDILTWEWSQYGRAFVLYRHTPVQDTRRAKHGVVDISEKNRGAVVATINRLSYHDDRRTFAYVETQEPLSVYMSAAV